MNVQSDLNLRWVHMSKGTFSDVATLIKKKEIKANSTLEKTIMYQNFSHYPMKIYFVDS